jgi:hypothetical protein
MLWGGFAVEITLGCFMSTASLIQLVSACMGILGSLFFAIGIMRQTIEAMGRLSGTYWDWNPHLPPALAAQKADYLFGGGLILIAFILQLVSFFASSQPVLTESQAHAAPWLAGIATVVAFAVLRVAARRLAKHYEAEITSWLKKKLEQPK